MSPHEILSSIRRQPFVPFRFSLTAGTVYEVRHPELCIVTTRSLYLGLPVAGDPDLLTERTVIVDLLHIVKLEPMETSVKG